jgi:ribonuclease T1
VRRHRSLVTALVAGLVVLLAAWLLQTQTGLVATQPATDTLPGSASAPLTAEPTEPAPGLPELAYADLPVEAQQTVERVRAGGPFPYEQDGDVFGNRELLLPTHAYGYYREYTVPTPGSDDRGARRIVVGSGGEVYYTADHYETFWRVRG